MIKTWEERVALLPYLKLGMLLLDRDKTIAMQAEIDELREALKAAESGPLAEEAYDIVISENSALKAKLAALEAQKCAELRASFNFDDREKITITAYGTTRDMQLLEARLTRGIPADQKLTALESQPLSFDDALASLDWADWRMKSIKTVVAELLRLTAGAAPVPRMTGAALASQEPVAEVLLVDGEKVIDASMAFFDSVELGAKLYLAAGAAPVPEGWQPIETAPKDGLPFRAYSKDLIDLDFNPNGSVECCWGGAEFVGCVWDGQQDAWYGKAISPTHWMPLPSAPKEQTL